MPNHILRKINSMYIRAKKIKRKYKGKEKVHTYYYLVEYAKENGKIKQKVIAYLGSADKIKKMFEFYKERV